MTRFTGSDLRRIAKALDNWERLLVAKGGGYTARAEFITRIEVIMPDGEDIIGHFVLEDEWLAFVPIGDV